MIQENRFMRLKILVILMMLILIWSSFVVSAKIISADRENEDSQIVFGSSFDGYTLFTPRFTKDTFLINNNGEIVHKWRSRYRQGLPVYLLENGSLLRSSYTGSNLIDLRFLLGGFTGGVEMLDWDGNLIWKFDLSSRKFCLHNDIEPLPNGNILMIAWEYISHKEAIAAGCEPKMLNLFGGIL